MSNLSDTLPFDCQFERPCRAIDLLIQPRRKQVGGFAVRRVLPSKERQMVGPWIFFDHMGPADFAAGTGINVPPHPHINLATVTYLFEGEILHRDSLGNCQTITPGDINLMVAGSGIVHSERERPDITAQDHRLHALQLWLALPEAMEEMAPAFFHYPSADIPAFAVGDVPVRVIMGSAYGHSSPVKVFADTLYVEAHLQPGQTLEVPFAEQRAVYVAQGALSVHDTSIPEFAMAVLSDDPTLTIRAEETARIAIIGGAAFQPRHMLWNFISSRPERLAQAKADWQRGRFPIVPGDEEDFVPFPG